MIGKDAKLIEAISEARILGLFKMFCDKNATKALEQRIRNIYSRTYDPIGTTKKIFANEYGEMISDFYANRLFDLIMAFLRKSEYRKPIGNELKKSLLQNQCYHCAICECDIDSHAHADHIVPFKFVGDELASNLQMLCADCNLKKNDSIDYQIKFMLRLS